MPEDQDRLLHTLERLLAIHVTEFHAALEEATQLVAEALGADKVDALFYDAATATLLAAGTSDTPVGRQERSLGMNRLPVVNGGRAVRVFQTGEPFRSGRASADPDELPGLTRGLGIESELIVPLAVNGERRGVLAALSTRVEAFTEADLRFLEAVARWVGSVALQAELVQKVAQAAGEQGRRLAAEELITILAHDIGNLLTPLKGHLDLLRRRAQRENREADLLEVHEANTALERIRRLITDLLDVARLEQGIFAVSPRPVDLAALVREAAAAYETPAHPIQVRAPEELSVRADADRVRQVLDNLLSNAAKHSPEGSPIIVTVVPEARTDGDWAVVSVADRGPGVAPEVLPRLFNRFSAGPGSAGLGLGLYIASRIAAAHGGTLTVDPVTGPGARFTLALPVAGPAD